MKKDILKSTFKWIIKWYFNHNKLFLQWSNWWIDTVFKWLDTRGNLNTIKRIKSIRLIFTRAMCGQPLSVSPEPGIRIRKDGYPYLGPFNLNFEDKNVIQFLLTCFSISRCIPGNELPDIDSITFPNKGNGQTPTDSEMSQVLSILGWNIEEPVWDQFHISTKAGPNGLALRSAITDLKEINKNPSLVRSLITLGGEKLEKYLTLNLQHLKDNFEILGPSKDIIRKFSFIHDPEGKTRIIAIFDYWSQTVLKPLHDTLFELLQTIPEDCTFDQLKIKKNAPKVGPFFSADLKSATDRMPVDFQMRVLNLLGCSEKYTEAWRDLMIGYPFQYKSKDIYYGVGQPMGAYSSWTAFTITHHVIVRVAMLRAGINPSSKNIYILLGDDIVIFNEKVYDHYCKIMKSLGVDISNQKTHISMKYFEFAKRWFCNGKEISPLPVKSLLEGLRNPSTLIEALRSFSARQDRNWSIPVTRGMIQELVGFCNGWWGRKAIKFANRAYQLSLIPVMGESREVLLDRMDEINHWILQDRWSCNTPPNALEIFYALWVHNKSESILDSIKNLSGEYSQFVEALTDILEGACLPKNLVNILPQGLAIRSELEKLQSEFERIRELIYDNRDEEAYFRPFVLPHSPLKAMRARRSTMILSAQARLISTVKKYCKELNEIRIEAYNSPDEEEE